MVDMIDLEALIGAESEDELKQAKLWLFKENMRLINERNTIEKEKEELKLSVERFQSDRVKFRQEMEELNRTALNERQRLREENQFFDKKMAILKDGFKHLEEDRKVVEREKKALAEERKLLMQGSSINNSDVGAILFRSASDQLGLRKRYRDLIKIFHPDNLFGDDELTQIINKEYERRKEE